MNDDDPFEVKEEIGGHIWWGGYHKCFDHMDDNELLGVDVKKIRDDYENWVREEMYYCETCCF